MTVIDGPTQAIMRLAARGDEHREAVKRFVLYNNDVEGCLISYQISQGLTAALFQMIPSSDCVPERVARCNAASLYHATCFVCAARRVGRLLESLASHRSCFADEVSQAIRLEWRKKRSFFESLIEPRNAIEHIDSEANDETKWSFFNMDADTLFVTPEASVAINDDAVAKIISSRDAIVAAIIQAHPDPVLDMLNQGGAP